MADNLAYQDLLYFGYDNYTDNCNGKKLQTEFMEEIKLKFPNVSFRDAYDNIKGYRQEVYLEKMESDNYYSWLIGRDWYEFSFTMQLIMMSASSEPDQKEKFEKYFKLAKQQYPESFKPEVLLDTTETI